MKAVQNQGEWPSLSPTLQDVTHLLNLFEEAKVIFNPRECNCVADRIANEALSHENYVPKLYSLVPNSVKNDVEKEPVV